MLCVAVQHAGCWYNHHFLRLSQDQAAQLERAIFSQPATATISNWADTDDEDGFDQSFGAVPPAWLQVCSAASCAAPSPSASKSSDSWWCRRQLSRSRRKLRSPSLMRWVCIHCLLCWAGACRCDQMMPVQEDGHADIERELGYEVTQEDEGGDEHEEEKSEPGTACRAEHMLRMPHA